MAVYRHSNAPVLNGNYDANMLLFMSDRTQHESTYDSNKQVTPHFRKICETAVDQIRKQTYELKRLGEKVPSYLTATFYFKFGRLASDTGQNGCEDQFKFFIKKLIEKEDYTCLSQLLKILSFVNGEHDFTIVKMSSHLEDGDENTTPQDITFELTHLHHTSEVVQRNAVYLIKAFATISYEEIGNMTQGWVYKLLPQNICD